MSTTIHVGNALDVLAGLPSESVHSCVTSPPYWGLRSYTGEPGMIGLEPTFDEHLANLASVFREVRRVLRDDGTLWLNYGSCYESGTSAKRKNSSCADVGGWARGGEIDGERVTTRGDAAPSRPQQRQNDPACGSDGRGLLDCREPDCVCSGLCGECQDAIRSRHGHTAGTLRPDAQSLRPSGRTDRDTELQDCSPLPPSQPAPLESSTLQSSPPPPAACSPERIPAVSAVPSAIGSSVSDAQVSVCRGCGRDIPGTSRTLPASCSRTGNGLSLLGIQ